MDNRFERLTFEGLEFLIESTEAPKIKAGGSSSSNIFNRYFSALGQDIALLATRTNVLARRSTRIEQACSAQAGALSSQLSALSSGVDAVSGLSQILATIFKSTYIYVPNTDCNLDYTFGQATLPVLSTTDLLVQEDVYGNRYVSPEVSLHYSTVTVSAMADLALSDYQFTSDAIFMLKQDQSWVVTKGSETKVTLKLTAPLQFRGLTPNVLEIWPMPALATTLEYVGYRAAGAAADVWTSVDLSYLPNYTASGLYPAGPVKIHLPNTPIVEIAMRFDVSSSSVWGLHKLKVYNNQYASSARLTVQDPYSRTVGTVQLRGKDPVDLSSLTVTTATNKAEISLTTTDSAKTPVITGVIMPVS